jgi:DNA-binding NarL/FixJ family response regulator
MWARQSRLMFSFQRRRPAPNDGPRPSPRSGFDPSVVVISVSADVAEDLPTLGQVLGDGFAVVVDEPDAAAVALVGPVGPVGVAFLRMAHPRPALVVVDRARIDTKVSAACVHAGAAGYVSRRSVEDVAACVRSLAAGGTPAGAAALAS